MGGIFFLDTHLSFSNVIGLMWAAAGFVDTSLSFSSFLELHRTDVPKRRVPTRQVVEPFDVVEHI